ncbi:MAG: hypothetical protein ACTSRA_02505 [Promethearchaeota archaeon]
MIEWSVTESLLYSLNSIEVFINFELFMFFVIKWLREKTERHITIIGLAYLFLGITRIFLIYWDFFVPVDNAENFHYVYGIAAFFAFLSMSVFTYTGEASIKKTKNLVTYAFIILAFIALVFNSNYKVVQMLYYIFSPLQIIFISIFIIYLMTRTYGSIRKKFFLVLLGLIFYGGGYGLGIKYFKDTFGMGYSIFTTSLVVIGLGLTGIGFVGVPKLAEIHWTNYIIHIYVFHIDTAVCIYDEPLVSGSIKERINADESDSNIPADLFSSGVVGIIGLIKEMIQSEKRLRILDHEDKKIMLEYGNHIAVALLTVMDLKTCAEKLVKYVEEIEGNFKDELENWDGEITKFKKKIRLATHWYFKQPFDGFWWVWGSWGKNMRSKCKQQLLESGMFDVEDDAEETGSCD